jgi:hypothetical protein
VSAKRKKIAPPAYHERRNTEQLEVYRRDITTFISNYRRRTWAGGAARQTLFFFPGGMACQLWRSRTKFKDSAPHARFEYDRLWLDLGTFLGNALKLGMQQDQDGLFRDQHEYIVIADGAVNLAGCTPHHGLIDWCNDNNVDLFVFNWDWRRRQKECADFFVRQFWPVFRQSMKDANIPEAAKNFSLLGHSFGGMIVKLILEGNDADVARKLKFAITAATPFYGYGEQSHRWFEGEELLNGDGKEIPKKLIPVICSMPGLYVLHYLDLETFRRDQAQLARDDFPLRSYPSVDVATGAPFDPWHPQTGPDKRIRYPTHSGFMLDELKQALDVYKAIAKRNEDPRFFNIRGVRLKGQAPRSDTVGGISCDWIKAPKSPPPKPPPYDPAEEGSPIHNTSEAPGDNTQPAWTARLVSSTNPGRCRTVAGEDLTHMFLMNDRGTLEQLGSILLGAAAAQNAIIRPRKAPTLATDDEVKEFLAWVADFQRRRAGVLPTDEEIAADMPESVRQSFPRLGPRIIEDIFKRAQRAPG